MAAKARIFLSGNERKSALKGAWTSLKASVTGQWEGWQRNRLRNRPATRLVAQDTDLDYGTREAMISEARSLCQVFPLAQRVIRQFAKHVVGSCRIQWDTGDENIDRLYEDAWRQWMRIADANGMHHFRHLCRLAVMSQIRDGDYGTQVIDSSGYLQLRGIEADRIANNHGSIINVDEDDIIGGVGITGNGRPKFYRVWDRSRYGTFKNPMDVPANEMLMLIDPDRCDAYRGVTRFCCTLNALRDLKEIIDAGRTNIKANSKLAILVKTVLGRPGPGVDLFANEDETQGSGKANVEELGDGAVQYMFPTEHVEGHKSDFPSDSFQGFVDWLVGLIAIGHDLPKGVLWSMLGTGPAVRFEISQAERTFSAAQDVLEDRLINPVAARVIANEIAKKRVPATPYFYRFRVQRPAYISIDAGRDSKAALEENRAGLKTGQSWAEESGEDIFEVIEQCAREAAFIKQMASKYGVDVINIREAQAQLTQDSTGKDVAAA